MRADRSPSRRRAAAAADELLVLLTRRLVQQSPRTWRRLARILADLAAILDYAVRYRAHLAWGHHPQARPGLVTALYFDVFRNRRSVCYLSRGWEDPGVRVGDLLHLQQRDAIRVKTRIRELVEACASQGVALQLWQGTGDIELHLWTPVYAAPLSATALHQAIMALQACKRRIRKVCPFA